ncbi:hypothetical protein [Lacimicrobium sp. SS2-24]|uniref:hypothetical protein n=1 Tax=Lacimicrobium sp. SS2-24 TaxID=2005569 RepID=UPI001130BCB9|nr:hypothetical protein [Lacimicrobium sp. SS2-24]
MNPLLFSTALPGRYLRLFVLCMFFLLTLSTRVQAENAPHATITSQAMAALHSARQDLTGRQALSQISKNTAYEKTLSDTEGNQTLMRFDPSQPEDKHWRVVSVTGNSLASVSLPSPFVLTPAIVDAFALTFFKEESDYWVFKGDMDIYASEAAGARDSEAENSNQNVDEYLVAFVRVDKQTHRFSRVSFTNLEAFHPTTLATIERFAIDAWYEPLVNDGPLIATNTELTVSGRYGFMFSFEEGIRQRIEHIN